MEIEQTRTFEKDIKKLTAKEKERLDKIITDIINSGPSGKQLHHSKDAFSIRVDNKRLVYQFLEKENKILLVLFKSRESVYEHFK